MRIGNKKESLILLVGDIFAFTISLWLSLLFRNLELPSLPLFFEHILPFSIISLVWIVFFFIAGLYDKQRITERKRLPEILVKTQLINSFFAIIFFYTLPYFGLAPKTILFFYIVISLILSFIWRVYAVRFLNTKAKLKSIIIGSGKEIEKLKEEINHNIQYGLYITKIISPKPDENLSFIEIKKIIEEENIKALIVDSRSPNVIPILPHIYGLIFSNKLVIDFYDLYENVFDRLPISLIDYGWFFENISTEKRDIYEFLKRLMDIVLAFIGLVLSIPFYIFAYFGIKFQDNGDVFIVQKRVGQNDKDISIIKFRTMTTNDQGEYDKNIPNKVTPFGAFLRKSRIDELPQLLNVIKGDLSLVGPRPELPALVNKYKGELPYYNMRHIIKPGLFGWAQLYHENHPHHGVDVEETQNKLSYDLYYIKHRSFPLDIIIALKTIKILLSRQGR